MYFMYLGSYHIHKMHRKKVLDGMQILFIFFLFHVSRYFFMSIFYNKKYKKLVKPYLKSSLSKFVKGEDVHVLHLISLFLGIKPKEIFTTEHKQTSASRFLIALTSCERTENKLCGFFWFLFF